MTRGHLTGLTLEEMKDLALRFGGRPFHGKSLFNWVQARAPKGYEAMTDLPRVLRERLAESHDLYRLIPETRLESRDGTVKILYRLPDGCRIETVRIPDRDRVTFCLSTQVGCPMGCRFCASGLKGLDRSLTVGEILDQVILTRSAYEGRLTNIVFMGIGEPLLNFDNLVSAIRLLNHPEGQALGARRITVSTVGIPPRIRELADLGLQIYLAISLHAANPATRERIIPVARKYPLEDILDAAEYYRRRTTRDVTFEVLLLGNLNDGADDAMRLADLLRGRKCLVNLIPFNEVRELDFKAPDTKRVLAFRDQLEKARIPVTIRRPRGQDIDAACGQLRLDRKRGTPQQPVQR